MVASFLMGWCGVVFREDISKVSELLTIGLTIGFMGSLATFGAWNQNMVELSANNHWIFAAIGYVIGLFLVWISIIFGIDTAEGFKWILKRLNTRFELSSKHKWKLDNLWNQLWHQLAITMMLVLVLGLLWGVSGALGRREFNSHSSGAQLWLACMVAPLGVWIRWFLARFNGRGLGRAKLLKWVPWGTLIANVSSASLMAVLAAVKIEVNSKICTTVIAGIEFGLLGCLGTISTFIAEFHEMRISSNPWRAYVYAIATAGISFTFATLLYSVPVWIKGYN